MKEIITAEDVGRTAFHKQLGCPFISAERVEKWWQGWFEEYSEWRHRAWARGATESEIERVYRYAYHRQSQVQELIKYHTGAL